MKIYLLVVTSDNSLRQYVGTQKQKVFPTDSLKKGFLSKFSVLTIVNSVDPRELKNPSDLENLIVQRMGDADYLLIMIDQKLEFLVNRIHSAALVCKIDAILDANRYQNFLHSRLGKLIKTLNLLAPLFDNVSDSTLLSLPLRNFKCPALTTLSDGMRNDPCSPEPSKLIDTALQQVRRRVRPRKKSSYKTKYAVDDQRRFFSFGKERHSLPETGVPHLIACKINAHFRFGCRIDHTRHFNVTEGETDRTSISGQFVNCHGQQLNVPNTTHINMFSNDFF